MDKLRESNIELLRILAMLAIVAHHFVWNSGVTSLYDFSRISRNMEFMQLFGAWGKTGINIFVLISGFFLCTSTLTMKRFLKVFVEAKFYALVCFAAFLFGGYEVLSGKRLFMLAFELIRDVNVGFTGTFLTLYLLSPFLNKTIAVLSNRQHLALIGLLLGVYTATTTFFFHPKAFNPLGWYVMLYFIAAYLRLHPLPWMSSRRFTGLGLTVSLVASCAVILIIDHTSLRHYITPYYLTNDCQFVGSLFVSIFAVLHFRTLRIGHVKTINLIASTTFGVFLIHTASDAMRTWLWRDLLDAPGCYQLPFGQMVVRAVASVVAVFLVCAAIDLLRQFLLAKPLQKLFWGKHG